MRMMARGCKAIVFDGNTVTPNCAARSPKQMPCWFRRRRTKTAIRCCAASANNSPGRAICDRSSIFRRSVFTAIAAAPGSMKRRRPSRGRCAAGNGLRPSRPGRNSARAVALPSPFCASPAFMGRARMRWCRSQAAKPAASSSPGRSSTAFMSAISRRRSMPRSRAEASGIFNVADDEPTPPGEPIVFAAQLMGVAPPPEIRVRGDAAPTMSPMALSFWQECRRVHNDKLKRALGVSVALSDLSRRPARAVCRAEIRQCRLGPLRKRLRSLDFTRTSMVSPSR